MSHPQFKQTVAVAAAGLAFAGLAGAAPLVVGYERFHSQPSAGLIEAGELLIGELGCVNCHQVSGDLTDRFTTRQAPGLEGIGARVNSGWLREWLQSPHASKEGTVMPDLLAGAGATERAKLSGEAANFLASLKGEAPGLSSKDRGAADADAGRELFHTIGCVACHEPDPEYALPNEAATAAAEPEVPSVPLEHVGAKYDLDGLAAFLGDPLKHRPAARMPRIPTTLEERVNLAAYLLKANSSSAAPFHPDASKIKVGRAAFAKIGCVSCHALNEGGKPVQSGLKARPLEALADSHAWGCLSSTPIAGVPFYDLNDRQRAALAAALFNLPSAKQVSFAERSGRLMTALNCFACHQRDQRGGPEDGRRPYFLTSGQDLEDEGRFPPTLTGVGRKLRADAMHKIIRGDSSFRPYMTTRMPDFGEAHAGELVAMFPTLDIPKDEKPTPREAEENQVGRNMWGRALLGAKGLSCIACHPLNGHKSLGIQAMDLANATQRLRPEWFRDYLIDPAKFRPGTRMPAFWPGGKPMLKGNGGSTERQIDSIWAYLGEIDQSRLPEGMEKTGNFELKPKEKPIVFRTFMETAGLHAIAVGFPGGVNAAFDSKNVHWSLFWRGKFLDAEGTWDDRFAPLAAPMGEAVVRPVASFPFTAAKVEGGAIVEAEPPSFKGFRLDGKGNPTLMYSFAGLEFEDTLHPSADGKSIRETIAIRGPDRMFLNYRFGGKLKPVVISHKRAVVEMKADNGEVFYSVHCAVLPPNNATTLILEWKW